MSSTDDLSSSYEEYIRQFIYVTRLSCVSKPVFQRENSCSSNNLNQGSSSSINLNNKFQSSFSSNTDRIDFEMAILSLTPEQLNNLLKTSKIFILCKFQRG